MSIPVIFLPAQLSQQLKRGHPWIYRNQVLSDLRLPSGTWVQVQCGKWTGYGLWDARSPIAVRVFSQTQVPDANWIAQRVHEAWQRREPLRSPQHQSQDGRPTSAYRWLFGEGDGMPGVVVDLYNDYAVLQTYAESLEAVVPWVVEGLKACTRLKGILRRSMDTGQTKAKQTATLWGRLPGQDLIVQENGLRLAVNLSEGQKTGLFLDHRENRRFIEEWCRGRRVLNCFAYTGAFSLYAVRGGAAGVVSVDIAPQAAEEARRNLSLNGFDPDAYPFIVADCFDLLDQYAANGMPGGTSFDLIILDPPSLAHAQKSKFAALRAYARLNQAAMRCLPPGGLLATASCTSQVSPDDFRTMLGDAAARAGKRLLILHEAGHALDHPVPAHFPEGRYLKFIFGRIESLL